MVRIPHTAQRLHVVRGGATTNCGVRAFSVGNETPIGQMIGVNVMCLEGVSDEELSRVPIVYVDGLHDRPDRAPAFFGHL